MNKKFKFARGALVRVICLCVLPVVLASCGDKEATGPSAARDTASPSVASERQSQPILVQDAWLRQPAPGQRMVAAFVTFKNNSDRAYTLNHVTSPRASAVEVHQTTNNDGVMSMRPVQQLTLAPQQELVFEPGGYHLMLAGVIENLEPGNQVPLTFHFAEGVTLEGAAEVRELH